MAGKQTLGKLEALDAAFKSITVSDLGSAVLLPSQFNRFLRMIQKKSVILPRARRINMPSPIAYIDRTGFMERVLRSGDAADGTHKVLVQSEYAKPSFQRNSLTAFEVQAITSIYDKTIRRNIERKQFANTLVDMFSEAIGRDLEELFILMNKDISPASDLLLSKGNGWVQKAVNKVYGVNAGTGAGTTGNMPRNFDPTSTDAALGFPMNMFQSMLLALPKQFLSDPNEWTLYVGWEVQDAYREQIAKRTGVTGDSALVEGKLHDFKGIKIEYAPGVEKSLAVAGGGIGRVAMLQHTDNMSWGVFQEVTLEPSRWPEERRTAYVITAEVDAGYEDENAAVVALIDGSNPA